MVDAVEESVVDSFTLKSEKFPNLSIAGQVKYSNKDFIFIQITNAKNAAYLQSKINQPYDVHFHMSTMNRVVFQQQHCALGWIIEHDLFDVLINNPKYDYIPRVSTDAEFIEQNYAFR